LVSPKLNWIAIFVTLNFEPSFTMVSLLKRWRVSVVRNRVECLVVESGCACKAQQIKNRIGKSRIRKSKCSSDFQMDKMPKDWKAKHYRDEINEVFSPVVGKCIVKYTKPISKSASCECRFWAQQEDNKNMFLEALCSCNGASIGGLIEPVAIPSNSSENIRIPSYHSMPDR